MSKKVTLPLGDDRVERLEALLSVSEHNAQTDLLRDLIDEAAAEHPEIDYEDPQPHETDDDDGIEYDPRDFGGILQPGEIHELLNTEASPAINQAHLPRTWMPRDQVDKAAVIAAVYRYEAYDSDSRNKIEVSEIIERVMGRGSEGQMIKNYHTLVERELQIRGYEPSNISIRALDRVTIKSVTGEEVDIDVDSWLDTVTDVIDDNYPLPQTKYKIKKGELLEDAAEQDEEYDLLSQIRSNLDALRDYADELRAAEEEQDEEEESDVTPVTDVKGVGEDYASKLKQAGVETRQELADTNPEEFAEDVDITEKRLNTLVENANN